jgi:prevent-host-death family protein
MEEMGLEDARRRIGEIVDRARLAGEHTLITRQGKPAAVVVGDRWYAAVTSLIEDMETLEIRGDRIARAYEERLAALRTGRRAAGLLPQDRSAVHHIDGDPNNNDPANLRIVTPGEGQS